MINKLRFIWHILFTNKPGIIFFHLSDEQQQEVINNEPIDIKIRYIGVDKRVVDKAASRLSKGDYEP